MSPWHATPARKQINRVGRNKLAQFRQGSASWQLIAGTAKLVPAYLLTQIVIYGHATGMTSIALRRTIGYSMAYRRSSFKEAGLL